jgi:hypothetical protein
MSTQTSFAFTRQSGTQNKSSKNFVNDGFVFSHVYNQAGIQGAPTLWVSILERAMIHWSFLLTNIHIRMEIVKCVLEVSSCSRLSECYSLWCKMRFTTEQVIEMNMRLLESEQII